MRNGLLADPNYFESGLPFLRQGVEDLQNHASNVVQRRHSVRWARRADKTAEKCEHSSIGCISFSSWQSRQWNWSLLASVRVRWRWCKNGRLGRFVEIYILIAKDSTKSNCMHIIQWYRIKKSEKTMMILIYRTRQFWALLEKGELDCPSESRRNDRISASVRRSDDQDLVTLGGWSLSGAHGLTNLSRRRMRLLLEKSENFVLEFVLSRFSRPFFVLNSLLARSKSRPLFHCLDAEGILLIGLFESVQGLCVRFLAKTIMLDYGPLLEH
jgi:hypothetical protein